MATYRVVPGTFSVTPVKSSYTTDEDIHLRIKCQLQRYGIGAWLSWLSKYYVYDANGKQIAYADRNHYAPTTPFGDTDTANDDFDWNIGKASSAGTVTGQVVVKASG